MLPFVYNFVTVIYSNTFFLRNQTVFNTIINKF